MKKSLALILSLMLLCVGFTAVAEDTTTVDITFDGVYVPFEELGFQLLLPTDWVDYEQDTYYFFVGTEDQSQAMAIDILDVAGQTLEEVAQSVAEEESIGQVAGLTINGLPFYLYELADGSAFGAFTNTSDNAYCIHFIFAPGGDEAFGDLALQIMASISPIA